MNLNSLLRSIFGDKSSRDMKLIQPLVEKVKAVSPEIEALSNDALRERTAQLRTTTQQSAAYLCETITQLKSTIEECLRSSLS